METATLLTREEAARELRINASTLDRLIRDGRLKASKFGATVRISRESLSKFLTASETVEPAAPRTRRASRVAQGAA